MIRKIIVVVLAVMLSTSAFAMIQVSWGGPSGFVRNDGPTYTPLVETGWSALAYLVFSYDAVAGAINEDGTIVGDVVLDSVVFDNVLPGNDYGAGFTGPSNYTSGTLGTGSGYLYMVVFDRGTSLGNTPAGTWYWNGGGFFPTLDNAGPPSTPDDVNAGPGSGGPGPFGTFILNSGQVIPEPATWAFLFIGLVALAGRKFRRG